MKKFYLLLMGMLFLSAGQMWAEDKDVNGLEISVTDDDNQIYSGLQLTPEVVVKDGDDILEKDTHYSLTYGENINAGDGAGSVTITGISGGEDGNGYKENKTVTFTIKRLELTESQIFVTPEEIKKPYNGGAAVTLQADELTVMDGAGQTLSFDIDGSSYQNNTEVTPLEGPKASVTINLTDNNHSGSKDVEFTIIPADLSSAAVTVSGSYIYNGTSHEPAAADIGVNLGIELDGDDYDISSYGKNTNATPEGAADGDKAYVEITGKGNYTGTAKGYFEIAPKAMTEGSIVVTIDDPTTYIFTGKAIEPAVTVKDGEDTLEKVDDKDYSIAYSNNTDAGRATITVTGKGNYKGEKLTDFDIEEKDLADEDVIISKINNQVLPEGGGEVTLSSGSLVVKYGEQVLVEGENEDFTTTYTGNNQVGEATVILTGKGNYKREASATFTIVGKDISSNDIEITQTVREKTYTGKPITLDDSELTVTDKTGGGSDKLIAGTDYTVEYTANTDVVDEVIVTIVGIGEWGNKKEAPTKFEIMQAVFNVTIDPIPDQKYEGKDVEPVIIVKFGDVVVDESEYTLDYKNNDKVGQATVEIISKGENFVLDNSNVITQTFQIVEDGTGPPIPNKEKVNILVGGGFIPSHKTGTYTVDRASSFIFTFKLEDTGVKEEDIIFKVNGSDTEFKKISANNYSFTILSVDRENTIEIGLKKYTLTLPEIKGCTLDPLPGTYDIDFNKPFTFTLILDDEYDESEVLVLVNGVVIEPEKTKATSYKFTIKNVLDEIKIEIKGVEANDPSGNVEVDSGVKLYTEGSNLIIETPKLMTVTVFTISGKMIKQRNVNGWDSISLDRGMYVVKLDNKVLKIIIK